MIGETTGHVAGSTGAESIEDKDILQEHIWLLHTTVLGENRIRKNLKTDAADVVAYCRDKVLDRDCRIYRRGKNWYCELENIKITINANSYTIITAHIMK